VDIGEKNIAKDMVQIQLQNYRYGTGTCHNVQYRYGTTLKTENKNRRVASDRGEYPTGYLSLRKDYRYWLYRYQYVIVKAKSHMLTT
jgi:hypothetical protein